MIAKRGARTGYDGDRGDRGIALLMALLVTTLLMALIIEFTYGTRVSLRAAVNFRDSQRAYYLARSGVKFVVRFLAENLKPDPETHKDRKYDNLVQQEWLPVPTISSGDTVLQVRWEDEAGKIQVTDVKTNPVTRSMLTNLFESKGIDVSVLDKMTDPTNEIQNLSLLTGLHSYMSNEEYSKVSDFLTVNGERNNTKINVNSASVEVLRSLGISADTAGLIKDERGRTPYTDTGSVTGIGNIQLNGLAVSNYLITTGNIFRVYSHATVGGYTKKAEAVIRRDTSGILYWKIL